MCFSDPLLINRELSGNAGLSRIVDKGRPHVISPGDAVSGFLRQKNKE